MQLASNGVAYNLWEEISGKKGADKAWKVGAIDDVANNDAESIGENLYGVVAKLDKDDTAISNNTGWSGTIGFNLLGGRDPYQSERLYNYDGVIDTLDDLKNVLFALLVMSRRLRRGI